MSPSSSQFYTTEAFDARNNSRGDVTGATTFSIGTPGKCTGATCTATAPPMTHRVTGKYSGKQATATLTLGSVLDLVKVWVGLATSDDVGIKFDLEAFLRKSGSPSPVASGQLGSVS